MTVRRDPSNPGVVVGPWPGSTATPVGPRRFTRQQRREIPRRYRTDKWGSRALMDCRECRTPWAPDVEIPRDRVCDQCRTRREETEPGLIPIDELKEKP